MWVKHPLIDEDGEITIAGPDGRPITRPMKGGVFEWPDELPLHNSYQPSPAPPELIELQRKREMEELIAKAQALGLKVELPQDAQSSGADDDGQAAAASGGKRKKKDAEPSA